MLKCHCYNELIVILVAATVCTLAISIDLIFISFWIHFCASNWVLQAAFFNFRAIFDICALVYVEGLSNCMNRPQNLIKHLKCVFFLMLMKTQKKENGKLDIHNGRFVAFASSWLQYDKFCLQWNCHKYTIIVIEIFIFFCVKKYHLNNQWGEKRLFDKYFCQKLRYFINPSSSLFNFSSMPL